MGARGHTGIESMGEVGGVRMSQRRMIEYKDAVEITVGVCGENGMLKVQLWIGIMWSEWGLVVYFQNIS